MINWINYLDIDNRYADNEDKKKILKFVFLWLKCNEYYNNEYTEICGDKNKFLELKENLYLQNKYKYYSEDFLRKFGEIYPDRQPNYYLINMKDNNKVYFYKPKKQRLEDLLKVIYQIRCNLFHGEKEPIAKDIETVSWAYDCLSVLVKDII